MHTSIRTLSFSLPLGLALFCARDVSAQACAQRETAPHPTSFAELGFSVALDATHAVSGAPESREVIVWSRSGGAWSYLQTLYANGDPNAIVRDFGWSVDVDGAHIIVGCVGGDEAHLFTLNPVTGQFEFTQLLVGNDTVVGDGFGMDVSLEGTRAFVSAVNDSPNGAGSGSVYVFDSLPAGWTQSAFIVASDGEADDHFGIAIDTEGNRLVVGAAYEDSVSPDAGSAYVYSRGFLGWSEEGKLVASDGAYSDYFGISVAIDGDAVIVGAEGDDDNGQFSGSAYVFRWSPGPGYTQAAKLLAPDGATNDDFGFCVACAGDTFDVGARAHQSSGAVYRYDFPLGGTATAIAKFRAGAPTPGETFGSAIDIVDDGFDSLIIGAAGHSVPGAAVAGAVYFPMFSIGGFVDCNGNLVDDSCDLAMGTATDVNHNGILDECEAVGTVYCTPNAPNSTGTWSKILASGSDVVANNDLTLLAFDLPNHASGYFLYGTNIGFVGFPAGSQGILCLTGGVIRLPIQNSGASGTYAFPVDLITGGIFPGQTWYFQGWHRDANPIATSNFTEAVEVVFQ